MVTIKIISPHGTTSDEISLDSSLDIILGELDSNYQTWRYVQYRRQNPKIKIPTRMVDSLPLDFTTPSPETAIAENNG